MKPCSYCGRENEDDALYCRECGTQFPDPSADTNQPPEIVPPFITLGELSQVLKTRRARCALGLMILALASLLFVLRDGATANAPRIVFLATSYTNGEQLVTFRPDPPSAEITYVDLVSVSDDGASQPVTVRSFGHVYPVRRDKDGTNYSLHYVAHSKPGVSAGGRPLAHTPGSYTVAYTPTESAHRVRVGVAHEVRGIEEYTWRLRNCFEHKTLKVLEQKLYRAPTFVTSEPITNAPPTTQ